MRSLINVGDHRNGSIGALMTAMVISDDYPSDISANWLRRLDGAVVDISELEANPAILERQEAALLLFSLGNIFFADSVQVLSPSLLFGSGLTVRSLQPAVSRGYNRMIGMKSPSPALEHRFLGYRCEADWMADDSEAHLTIPVNSGSWAILYNLDIYPDDIITQASAMGRVLVERYQDDGNSILDVSLCLPFGTAMPAVVSRPESDGYDGHVMYVHGTPFVLPDILDSSATSWECTVLRILDIVDDVPCVKFVSRFVDNDRRLNTDHFVQAAFVAETSEDKIMFVETYNKNASWSDPVVE